jgi:hypothetical protein
MTHVNRAALCCESHIGTEHAHNTADRVADGLGQNMRITSKIKVLRSPPALILPERNQSPRRPEENENTETNAKTGVPNRRQRASAA